ncbi:multidrug efflux SMR transporter [soil metagenome]|nr:multidrug efflux SMR transporter [Thermoleophilaceae bacterium]MDQ3241759.1 multidrug efflux SMR transporter [Actinomycetota bacterium]MDQ3320316.1 multidrug efflux SMR transporter [Actinomycetota bacterium]MDQ3356101.1 multidrug efflux SMR transporter [Actinomycetota bacterium]
MTWLLLGGAILSEVIGTLALRASEGFSKLGPSVLMGVGYVVSFLLLAQVLERGMTVGVAYAIWAGLGVALVAVLGRLLFDDPLTWVTGAGIVAIVGGVVLVEASTASR